jgi:ABC-type nitrate/sulfonate/bicarbonate transport system permease component
MAGRIRRWGIGFNWLGLAVIVVVLLVWQLVVASHLVSYSSLPGPIQIVSGLSYIASNGMWSQLLHTVRCVAISWGIAVAVGGIIGLALALSRGVAFWATATIDLFRSLPVVALIPIAILIWGTGTKTEIILGAYAGLWPMVVNTSGGVSSVTPTMLDVALTFRLSKMRTLRKVIMPATGGAMLVGARLALATTLVVCVVSEMVGLQSGIGYALVLEQGAGQPERMWAYVLIIGTLGIIVNAGLVRAVRIGFPGISAVSQRSAR